MHSWDRGSDETAQPHHTKESLSGSSAFSTSYGHITGGNASGTLSLASCQLGAALGDSPFSLLSLAGKDTPAAALDQCQSCGVLLMGTCCVKAGTPHIGIM